MTKTVYFAGGCFWGVEKYFSRINGVVSTEVGYANGRTENPTYEEVCSLETGHAETVKVAYDADRVSLQQLLERFYRVVDPLAVNRQGPDIGTQYRSGIYFTEEADLPVIRHSLAALQQHYTAPLAIEVLPLENFFPAETYHQKYLDKNPGGYCHIPPAMFEDA